MSYSVGDGLVAFALAAGVVGYVYVTRWSRQKRLEIIHQERLVAMEKGIPLPEFPLDPVKPHGSDPNHVLPILGIVLLSLSLGAMVVLYLNLQAKASGFWVAPLPFAFLGVGLVNYHFMKREPGR